MTRHPVTSSEQIFTRTRVRLRVWHGLLVTQQRAALEAKSSGAGAGGGGGPPPLPGKDERPKPKKKRQAPLPANWESMPDAEFEELFGMSRSSYDSLVPFKQASARTAAKVCNNSSTGAGGDNGIAKM
eukprot:COSAG02_NODE_8319_length_2618_cov_1.494641_2_plen_128_part_00